MDKGRLFSGRSMPFSSEEVCLFGDVVIPKGDASNDTVSSKLFAKALRRDTLHVNGSNANDL